MGQQFYDLGMVPPLAQRHCVACRPGTQPLPPVEVARLLAGVPGWAVEAAEGGPRLARTIRFKGFLPGVDLVNRIATIAESEGHHPDLLLAYGSLTIRLTTHAAGGLTENDFILAARLDEAI
jgi:4a-hydroxytetrahydrobiopterin dehydratase